MGDVGGERPKPATQVKVRPEAMVKKVQLINPNAPLDSQGGFHCDLCQALFKSYDAYLDHCNGRLHQRNLGAAPGQVERIEDPARIRARLAWLKERQAHKARVAQEQAADPTKHIEDRILQRKLEDEAQRKRRYDKKKKRPVND